MKLLILLFLIFNTILNALDLSKEEREFLDKHKSFKVYMEKGYAPFSFVVNNKLQGFSIEFSDLIANKLGVEFNYSNNLYWNEAVENLKEKKIDVIAQMMYTKKRGEFALFSDDYISYYQSIIVNKENSNLDTLEKLNGKKVGMIKGYVTVPPIKENFPDIDLVLFNDTNEILEAISNKSITAAITTHQVIQHYIINDLVRNIVSIPLVDSEYLPLMSEAFAVRKDFSLLQSSIQKALMDLENEKKKLQEKWFGVSQSDTSIPFDKNIVLSQNEKRYLKNKSKLTMCIDPNWMPFERFDENNRHIGMTADYFKLFEKLINKRFEVVHTTSWSQSLEFAKSRKCDILSLAMETPERKKYMNFTKSYLNIPLVIATKMDINYIDSIDELAGYNVGIPKGYAFGEFIKNDYPNVNIIEVKDIHEGLHKVSKGEIFAYIGTISSIGYEIQKRYFGEVKITGKLNQNWELAVAARNDDLTLLSILNKVINSISQEEHRNILNKWISIKFDQGIDYTIIWQIIIAASILLIALLYHDRKISYKNVLLEKAHEEIKQKNIALEKLATTDKLTEIYNRVKLDELLNLEILRSQRYEHEFGLCILDIDHFKSVNDTYGHQEGDNVLKSFAKILRQNIRKTDYVGRWGGEEFIILCTETDREGVLVLIEKIRAEIENYEFGVVGKKTASFGVSMFRKEDDAKTLILRADEALYKAKETGRNKVILH